MRLLCLVYAFPPLEVSGSLRSRAFAEHFPDCGIEPVIVCADSRIVASRYPGGVSEIKNWTDDSRWREVVRIPWNEDVDSRPFAARLGLRLPLLATHILRRERHARVEQLAESGARAIERHRPAAIYCSVAPATTALAGAILSRRYDLPLIVDIRDPWSYGPPRPYRHFVDFLLERHVERRTLSHAELVVTPTRAAKKLLVRKLSIPESKIAVVPNGYERHENGNESALEQGLFTILHAGEAGTSTRPSRSLKRSLKRVVGIDYDPMCRDFASRNLETPLRALDLLLERRPELRERIRLRFLGVAPETAAPALARTRFAGRVVVEPRVSRETAESMIRRADALLLLQVSYWLDGRPFCPAIPAKLYSYLAAGKPVLAVAQESEITELIEGMNAGQVVPPHDVESLSRAMEMQIDAWSSKGQPERALRDLQQFSRGALTAALARRIRSLVATEPA